MTRRREYRKIYEEHFGKIPKDHKGRSYDIHHIDGDYTNNDISNLIAVSIEEHYKIHKDKEEWGAAWAVSRRFNVDPNEKSKLITKMNLDNAEKGIHWSQVASKQGIHPFQDREFQKYMAAQSKSKGNRSCDREWTCEICGCFGKGASNYTRYHGENCGVASKHVGKIWINNDKITKMIDPEELSLLISEGWQLGRGSTELTSKRLNSKGTTGRANPYIRKTNRPYNTRKV
jgi:hypothetical protein